MKKKQDFIPTQYQLTKLGEIYTLSLKGQKSAPPSKRITLFQNNIRVLSAKIICKHKKGNIEFGVSRINRLKSFSEIRLHTNNILYPGFYTITLEYTGELDESQLGEKLI